MAEILIIGGGVAGLSAGIYARLNDHRAIICERNSVAGGNLTGWQRGEYHIDNCIHWLTGTNPNTETYRTWTELGALGDTPVYQADTLYTCEADGARLSLLKDLGLLQNEMLALSPEDGKETEAFIGAIKAVQGLCGIAGERCDRTNGFLKRFFTLPALLRYHSLSTGELSDRFSHPLLRKFISCFIGRDFSAVALIFVFATFCGKNGGIPQGGSCAMAQRMTERFISLGGELLYRKDAIGINVVDGRAASVNFADGTSICADYVVCTADPKVTFEQLLRCRLPKIWRRQYENSRLQRFSSYHCAFAYEDDSLPFSGDLIFELTETEKATMSTEYMILREFTHEKSYAPEGHTVLQTMTFCNERAAREFIALRSSPTAYALKKQGIAKAVQQVIIKKFPEFKGKIHCLDVWTPATYQRYTRSETGSYMSFILPKKYLPRAIPCKVGEVKNLVLATQWQQAPGGLPTAASMGKRAIEFIQRKEKRRIFPNPQLRK